MEEVEGIFRMGRCNVIVTRDAGRWHMSVSTHSASPSYKELKAAKEQFLPPDLTYGQLFVPEEQHVNLHQFTHHLWEIEEPKTIGEMLTEHWEEQGYTSDSTESFLELIEAELSDHSISAEINVDEDGNPYTEEK